MIHDLGFRARIKDNKKGFQLYVGGGLGASPSLGQLWSEFIPVEEMIPLSTAIVRIFDRHGERKSKNESPYEVSDQEAWYGQIQGTG